MKEVIKRNGTIVPYDIQRIVSAIKKANDDVKTNKASDAISDELIEKIAEKVEKSCEKVKGNINVEQIQDFVEIELMKSKAYSVAKSYVTYRYSHKMKRMFKNTIDTQLMEMLGGKSEYWNSENSNKNATLATTQRDYMAGIVSKDISERYLLPEEVVDAHKKGIIHFHDIDYFGQLALHNCSLVNLEDMLQNGTVISGTLIEKPHSFSTACNIATQIIAQVASSQYGGQSVSLTHLAPFVEVSRKKFRKQLIEQFSSLLDYSIDQDYIDMLRKKIDDMVEKMVKDEIKKGVQTIQYQVETLMTTNGQAPFITVYMYLGETDDKQTKADLALIIEEVLKQRIEGVKNEAGVYITPAFPKLIYVLEEDNVPKDSKYHYLTELAAKCTAKRMVPDYISEKIMKKLKGDVYTCMGCRSFLTPDRTTTNVAKAKNYVEGKHKYYGRFNQGVVTINLPDVALSAGKDLDAFWNIFNERMELCHKALRCRHERLKGIKSDVAPILWQYGALARLEKGEVIDPLLYGGYSTISLGYAGLYECVYALIGKKLTEPEGEEFGLKIMKALNDYTAKWKAKENIDYSLYGTPLESTTYKFAKSLKERFGVVEGVSDRDYITNSYHVHVTEKIDAFSKLALESKFQELSPGGAISYVEVPNMQQNIDAVLVIMEFIYNNIMYAELNTKSDYCQVCGFSGEIQIIEKDDGKLDWRCPNCGNMDHSKLNIARRTCGYIGSQFWNQGRTQEIKDRVIHVG